MIYKVYFSGGVALNIWNRVKQILSQDGLSKITFKFTQQEYYKTDLKTYALHEVSHAALLCLYDDFLSIEHKHIVINKESDSHFSYSRNEDPNARELYVDMIVCLSGLVAEMHYLNIQGTSAYEDIQDWHKNARRWLIHYCSDYIAFPQTEEEIKWNNHIIHFHKMEQASIIKMILNHNSILVNAFADNVVENVGANNKEINEFLTKMEIPREAVVKLQDILDKALIKWI
jgi:hypothetical protein